MKLQTVVTKLKKEFGYTYKEDDNYTGIVMGSQELTFGVSGTSASRFHVRPLSDKSNPQADYHAGTFASNFKQAVNWLKEA
jgi:hypothetical protein